MPAKGKPQKDDARRLWFSLDPAERGVDRFRERLIDEEIVVGRSTLGRWIEEWRKPPGKGKPVPVAPEPPAVADLAEPVLRHLPAELVADVNGRLAKVAGGTGLDQVEGAIGAVASAIQGCAERIAETPELAEPLVAALEKLSGAMDKCARARVVVADAHRAFSEGDREAAEARKLNCEAEAVLMDARARNARDVTPPGHIEEAGGDEAAAALAALRGMATGNRRPA